MQKREDLQKENQEELSPNALNFKDYINEKMSAVESRSGHTHVTSSELAQALGLNTKVFLEIMSGRRDGSDRRDFVIALCAELGLDADETDEALRLYPGFSRGLSDDDDRDRAITDFLNSGFDVEISCSALDRFLSEAGFPELKIRYRNPSKTDFRRRKPMKKIDWNMQSAEVRSRYYYYTSLGYDDKTASVLALFTYGSKAIPEFSIVDAYNAFVDGGQYPPQVKTGDQRDCDTCRKMHDMTCAGLSCQGYVPMPHASAPINASTNHDRFSKRGKSRPGGDSHSKKLKDFLEDDSPGVMLESDDGLADFDNTKYFKLIDFDELLLDDASLPFDVDVPQSSIMGLSLADDDEYEPIEEKDQQTVVANATSTFRMTTNTASAGIVLNQLRNGRSISRDMVRIEEWLNYFRYQSVKPEHEMFRISHELKDLENGNKLLYVNVQGREEEKEHQNIVLLLDVSGSMLSHAAMTQAAVATVVSRLKPGCTLSLVTYGPCDTAVLEGFRIESYESKVKVLEKLLGLEINGYTYGSAGIERAYQVGRRNYIPEGNNQVILITDGDLNFGIVDKGGLEKLIEAEKKSNLFLSVLGIGLTNYKDDKLEVLCKHGNGVYRVINNLSDIKKCVRDEYASLVNIIAKDVKAQVEFNPELVSSFRLLGFENRELSHDDFKDDTVISEPFGSGGYGVALYELGVKEPGSPILSDLKYRRVVSTGSEELATVKVRYKEPLEDRSHELEYVVPSVAEHYTDNLLLAWIVYVCAEKLRDSDKITARDEALALAAFDELGKDIKLLNFEDIDKLREILRQSKQQLRVGRNVSSRYDW